MLRKKSGICIKPSVLYNKQKNIKDVNVHNWKRTDYWPALEWNKPTDIFSPLPLKSSLCQIIVIFNIFLHIYYNEKFNK
jgi:hypothetical protein